MKVRVLNYGFLANHPQMTALKTLWSPIAISDYDAFLYDPQQFDTEARSQGEIHKTFSQIEDREGVLRASFRKHSEEVATLLMMKGGVVVVLLRPNDYSISAKYSVNGRSTANDISKYFILDRLNVSGLWTQLNALKAAHGSTIILDRTKMQPPYLTGLKDSLTFQASFPNDSMSSPAEILAVNSIGASVALSIKVGRGTLLLLPVPSQVEPSKLGAILVETVRLNMTINSLEKPSWADEVAVPGVEQIQKRIEVLEEQHIALQAKLSAEQDSVTDLLKFRELLYGTGKLILETAVRRAFRTLGFLVLEASEYVGEWDIDMSDPTGQRLIGEVEGPEGAIDVQKFRQLLNYWNDELIEDREAKGLLIGNAYRNVAPNDRGDPFTQHALRGAEKHGFALIATTELFAAVCAVLSSPEEQLKKRIRSSLLSCVGPWRLGSLAHEAMVSEEVPKLS